MDVIKKEIQLLANQMLHDQPLKPKNACKHPQRTGLYRVENIFDQFSFSLNNKWPGTTTTVSMSSAGTIILRQKQDAISRYGLQTKLAKIISEYMSLHIFATSKSC